MRRQTYRSAVIYLRVSTGRQADSGLGREAQEAECRAHCQRMGVTVLGVYVDDGLSGTLPVERRAGLAAAVQRAREGAAVLLVYSVSRAARSVPELYRLVQPGGALEVPLVSATEPFDMSSAMGRAFLGMLAVLAALESDLASERTTAALAAAQDRGVRLGRPPELTAEHPAVQRARALRAEGLSERAMAARLNVEGVATPRGGRWHQRTVRAALALLG